MRSKVAEEVRRLQAEAEAKLSVDQRLSLLAKANAFAAHLIAAVEHVSVDHARERLKKKRK